MRAIEFDTERAIRLSGGKNKRQAAATLTKARELTQVSPHRGLCVLFYARVVKTSLPLLLPLFVVLLGS